MIYVDKFSPTRGVQHKLIRLKACQKWKDIQEGDTAELRKFFDDYAPKDELRYQLWKHQHGLCVYCMKQIEPDRYARKDRQMKIEHWHPLSKYKDEVLDYHNLMGACMGGEKSDIPDRTKRSLCCDSKKGEKEIIIDPGDKLMMQRICYRNKGAIIYYDAPSGTDEEHSRRIKDNIDVDLQLNGVLDEKEHLIADTATQVVKSRQDAYGHYESIVSVLSKKGKLTSRQISGVIDKLLSQEQYMECVGVMIFYLQRKKRQLERQGK